MRIWPQKRCTGADLSWVLRWAEVNSLVLSLGLIVSRRLAVLVLPDAWFQTVQAARDSNEAVHVWFFVWNEIVP